MSLAKSDYAAMRRVAKGWLVIFGIVLIVGVVLVGVSFALPSRPGFGGGAGLFGNADLIVTNSSSTGTTGGFFGGSSSTLNQSVLNRVSSVQGVAAATAELTASGYIGGNTVIMTGIDPTSFSNVSTVPSLSSGQFITSEGAGQIVIGGSLASTLGDSVGATVAVEANSTSRTQEFTIVGITPTPSFSGRFGGGFQFNPVYVSLEDLQSITNRTGLVNRILVRLVDTSQSSTVSSAIDAIQGVQALTPGSFRMAGTGGFGGFGGAGGASSFGAISRPGSLRGILLIAGLVVAPIGGLGTFWGYRKLSIAKRRERLQQRKKGRGKNSQQ